MPQLFPCPENPRLARQLRFLVEVDKVKHILRRSKLFDGSRLENDAEHSWTLCLMAILGKEHSDVPVDLEKVLKMLLLHDVVEIDGGDTFLYSSQRSAAAERERVTAERVFGLLEEDQRHEFMALWEEFELRESPEARFAAALDRIEPLLQNYLNEGFAWKTHGVSFEMVKARNAHIAEGSAPLWDFVRNLLDEAQAKGYFHEKTAEPASQALPSEMNVRACAREDLEAVAELFDAYRQFYGKPSDPSGSLSFLRERFESSESVLFVAEFERKIVGFTQLYPSFSSAWMKRVYILNDLFVHPSARRLGAATKLLEGAQAFARDKGAIRLTLSTAKSNLAAQQAYRRGGWVPDEEFLVFNRPLKEGDDGS